MLQKHKMSLLYVKDKLIESLEVLMFFNAINPIKTCLFSWGYNGHYQNGVQFTNSIREFYDQEVEGTSNQKFMKPKFSSYTVDQNRASSHNISQESSEELIVTEKTKFQETKEQDFRINKMAEVESKANNLEGTKSKFRSQLSLPMSKDSSQHFEIAKGTSRKQSIMGILDSFVPVVDPTRELEQVINLMKSQQILSSWAKNDHICSTQRPNLENMEFGEIHKIIQRIETPRLNYEMLDKKLKLITGKRFVNFYLTENGHLYSSGKNI